jgi:hypothetical protein
MLDFLPGPIPQVDDRLPHTGRIGPGPGLDFLPIVFVDDSNLMAVERVTAGNHRDRRSFVPANRDGPVLKHKAVPGSTVDERPVVEGWKSETDGIFRQAVNRHQRFAAESAERETLAKFFSARWSSCPVVDVLFDMA